MKDHYGHTHLTFTVFNDSDSKMYCHLECDGTKNANSTVFCMILLKTSYLMIKNFKNSFFF